MIETLERQGLRLRAGVEAVAAHHGLQHHFQLIGRPSNLVYRCCDREGQPSQAFRTLFLQETIRRGILAPSFVVSYSHSDDDIDQTIEAVDGALSVYRHALEDGIDTCLIGRPVQPVFTKRAMPPKLTIV